jgi:hypothetical protein
MNFVRAEQLSGQRWNCALTGRSTDDEGFFDARRALVGIDPDVHISAAGAKEMARMLGWHSPEEIEGYLTQLREMGAEIQALQHRLESIETVKRIEAELQVAA